jgi:hypothetical protein
MIQRPSSVLNFLTVDANANSNHDVPGNKRRLTTHQMSAEKERSDDVR